MYALELVGASAVKIVETVGGNLASIYRGTRNQIQRASFMLLVTFLAYSSALKAEVVSSTESSGNLYWITRMAFLTANLHGRLHEALKCNKIAVSNCSVMTPRFV
jgi:hypothetical protein